MEGYGRYIVFTLLVALILIGIGIGDFTEVWRNGATL